MPTALLTSNPRILVNYTHYYNNIISAAHLSYRPDPDLEIRGGGGTVSKKFFGWSKNKVVGEGPSPWICHCPMETLVNLSNRTGEERRRLTLCDKRDNNFA